MLYLPAGSTQIDLIEIIENEYTSNPSFIGRLMKDKPLVLKDVHLCLVVEFVWDQLEPKIIISYSPSMQDGKQLDEVKF